MLSIILFSLFLFSGSLIAYTSGDQRIMRVVPVTLMALSLFLFLFGLLGNLMLGMIVLHIVMLLIYVVCGIKLYKHGISRSQLIDLGKSYGVVLLFVVIVSGLNIGMMAHTWDEFSHWADIVKAMYYLNDLGTNPLSHSMFPDYPPGMALLQYIFVKEESILTGIQSFQEWRLFAVYHFVVLSLLFPFLDDERINITERVSICILILSGCCFFYSNFFDAILIDPAIAVIGSYILCLILFSRRKDTIYNLSILFGCLFLVLLKDVGMLFACVGGLVYFFDRIKKPFVSLTSLQAAFPLLASLLIKLIWKIKVSASGITAHFQQSVDFYEYFQMLLLKNGTDYRQEVVNKAFQEFFEHRYWIGPIALSYFKIIIFTVLLTCLAVILLERKNDNKKQRSQKITVIFISAITTIAYAIFIGAMYAYRFSEEEAITLASYQRYMNICFLFFTVTCLVIVFYEVIKLNFKTTVIVLAAFAELVLVDNQQLRKYLFRSNIVNGLTFKERYDTILDAIEEHCNESDVISIVSMNESAIDSLAMNYYCRPMETSTNLVTNSSEMSCTPEEYMNHLIEDGVTYVAIIQQDDIFSEQYDMLFENKDSVEDNSLFSVDTGSRKLIRCN